MSPAEKLLDLLSERRLDQKSVAKEVGVAYNTFRSYLKEEKPSIPASDTGVKIARLLEVPSDWLWSNDDWPPPTPGGRWLLKAVDDFELVQELLGRKVYASKALGFLFQVYINTRDAVRKSDMSESEIRPLYESILTLTSVICGSRLLQWSEFERMWNSTPIIPSNDPDSVAEFISVGGSAQRHSTDDPFLRILSILEKTWGIETSRLRTLHLEIKAAVENSRLEDSSAGRRSSRRKSR